MILILNTSTPICHLSFIDGDWRYDNEWQADRTLARDLLSYLQKNLKDNNKTWSDITGIGVYEGPGSFTGLRIGITVMNTIADTNKVPIVGGRGENWQNDILDKLNTGKNEKIVLPFYGSEAHITTPKK
jgi:tRNA threonylcarbamoyladenosine biosynthesis protein TsaB